MPMEPIAAGRRPSAMVVDATIDVRRQQRQADRKTDRQTILHVAKIWREKQSVQLTPSPGRTPRQTKARMLYDGTMMA